MKYDQEEHDILEVYDAGEMILSKPSPAELCLLYTSDAADE